MTLTTPNWKLMYQAACEDREKLINGIKHAATYFQVTHIHACLRKVLEDVE